VSHSHAHSHSRPHGPDRAQSKRALLAVLALTSVFTVVEVVAGVLSGSLALLADAGHMLSDSLSLGVALFAIWLAERPPTPNRSFGYQRAEILAALANGVTLVAISVWIFIEAYGRFDDPPEVTGSTMLVVAVAGLLVNAVGARILWRSGAESLNMSAALRHVLADLLGSLGVIVAALVILATDWLYADPLVSVLIGLLILASSWGVLRDATRVLIEASPAGLDASEVGTAMAEIEGVVEVHDLHLWEVTSGFPALSAHVLADPEADCPSLRLALEARLAERFAIEHTTLQVENVPPRLIQIEDT
jgi:cobalt-zinc-cadmium efflux system protein